MVNYLIAGVAGFLVSILTYDKKPVKQIIPETKEIKKDVKKRIVIKSNKKEIDALNEKMQKILDKLDMDENNKKLTDKLTRELANLKQELKGIKNE